LGTLVLFVYPPVSFSLALEVCMFWSLFERVCWFLSDFGFPAGVDVPAVQEPFPCSVSTPYGWLSVCGCSLRQRVGLFGFVGGHVFGSSFGWFWRGDGSLGGLLCGPRTLVETFWVCAFRGWR